MAIIRTFCFKCLELSDNAENNFPGKTEVKYVAHYATQNNTI